MLDNQVLITYITQTLGGAVPAAYHGTQGRIRRSAALTTYRPTRGMAASSPTSIQGAS
jgi:hypothetical protein